MYALDAEIHASVLVFPKTNRYDDLRSVIIMTHRLYYEDAYLTQFDATVTACAAEGERFAVKLDRSAFYPTSGGQPYDTGAIGCARVVDVQVVDGDVTHYTDRPLDVGTHVRCEIDWPRRFDHMQQHAADHMIAGCIWRTLGGITIGLHESDEVSTIDVAMPDGRMHLTDAEIAAIEADVNAHIQRDVPIRCWFPEEDELAQLPLRKKPTVTEHVRVVAIGDDEMVACGGTHPSSAGQIGLVKIVSATPARGKLRIGFLAGGRALRDYAACYAAAHAAAERFSAGVDRLEENVAALQERLKQAQGELNRLREERALARLEAKLSQIEPLADGVRLLDEFIDGDAAMLKACASKLIARQRVVALLGARTEAGAVYVFGRSADVNLDMGRLLSRAAKPLGGKGGGRPDFAQGGGCEEILRAARTLAMEEL